MPNRFLHGGFFASLEHQERSLYLFLVLAAGRQGVSCYHHVCISSTIAKDLIAFDGSRFQVPSLPASPLVQPRPHLLTQDDIYASDSATIRQLIARQLGSRR